ncbi:hypothetical protein FHR70_003920 [Microvirga lupini]|uniref:DUF2946 domain-containing protein n=1 Tax=Microvirga lupini TaxID=420324 RepID=A0A7W4VPB6_9HYPH|nr:hypothetical protein [Microvirga lupini]MBB3020832.1 hypothetical protein [Microvirga lupini]
MDRRRNVRSWCRQATALVAALSLILHVGLMALATQPPSLPAFGGADFARHVHYSGDANGSHHDRPGTTAGHAKPCCILSHVNGMPAPPAASLPIPPYAIPSVPDFEDRSPSGAARSLTSYPVGARAPPALA